MLHSLIEYPHINALGGEKGKWRRERISEETVIHKKEERISGEDFLTITRRSNSYSSPLTEEKLQKLFDVCTRGQEK